MYIQQILYIYKYISCVPWCVVNHSAFSVERYISQHFVLKIVVTVEETRVNQRNSEKCPTPLTPVS